MTIVNEWFIELLAHANTLLTNYDAHCKNNLLPSARVGQLYCIAVGTNAASMDALGAAASH